MSRNKKILILILILLGVLLSVVIICFSNKKNRDITVGEGNIEKQQQNIKLENITNVEDSIFNSISVEDSNSIGNNEISKTKETASNSTKSATKNDNSNSNTIVNNNLSKANSSTSNSSNKTHNNVTKSNNSIKTDSNTIQNNSSSKNNSNVVKNNNTNNSSDQSNSKTNTTVEKENNESTFDINYWIDYAKSYGISIGLKYDTAAIECWDNPIIAGAKVTTLQRDIKDRLNSYKNVEEVTDFCVWAEKRSDGKYNLYIGYA